MSGMFSKTTKLMLRNVLRHTDAHNRVVEEAEMWQQYERHKSNSDLDSSHPSFEHDDRCSRGVYGRGQLWERDNDGRKRKVSQSRHVPHMDQERLGSTYWMRQLDKVEKADPNRWDHGGYRELYPEDFDSDRSCDSVKSSDRHKSRTRKPKHAKKREKKKSKTKRRKVKDQTPEEKPTVSILEDLNIEGNLANHSLHLRETQKCHEQEEAHKQCHKRCRHREHKNHSTCHKRRHREQERGNHITCHNNFDCHDDRGYRGCHKHRHYLEDVDKRACHKQHHHKETEQKNTEDKDVCTRKLKGCKCSHNLLLTGHKSQSLGDGLMEWVEVTIDSVKH